MSPGAIRIAVALAALALAACGSSSAPEKAATEQAATEKAATVSVRVGGTEVRADVAETAAARERGLSGRPRLAEGRGMLFVYPDHAVRTYWMKGMRFPIDIVWIDEGEVTGIERDAPVPQGGDLPLYSSRGPADHVLEVPAGWAGRHGVVRGARVVIEGG
jgi:uncharacterized membrane protein (UPF0127 family)